MPAEFRGQNPVTPSTYQIRLICDRCHGTMELEVPCVYQGAHPADPRVVLAEAVRYAERYGWQWERPGESNLQTVTCNQCYETQRQLQQALAHLPGSNLTPEQITQLAKSAGISAPPFHVVTDPTVPRDSVYLTGQTFITHPDNDFREQVAAMIQQGEGDPDYRVFARADVELARMGNVAVPWDGLAPNPSVEPERWHERASAGRWADAFRQELMGEFPEPEPEPEPVGTAMVTTGGATRIRYEAGTFVDREGRTWTSEPWEADILPGGHTVGIDPAVGEDECVASIIIDGKPIGQTVRLRRDHMKVEVLRKSKWERLMEDDDEPCP